MTARSAPAVPPVLVAAAAAGVQLALTRGARPSAPSAAAAAPVVAASTWLLGGAVHAFRGARTTVDPTAPDRAGVLVVSGANAITRNPMYVGMAGILLGNAVARRSWLALLPVGCFVAVLGRGQIRAEERALGERFGPSHAAYRQRVPHWLDGRSARAVLAAARLDEDLLKPDVPAGDASTAPQASRGTVGHAH